MRVHVRPIHAHTCILLVEDFSMCVYCSEDQLFLSDTSVCPAMDRIGSLCSTNGTKTRTEQWAFCLVMIFIYAAILVFTTIVLASVVAAKAIRGTLCFVLANILVASITACVGIGLICVGLLISINSDVFSHTDALYKIVIATTAIGGNGRSAFMAVFSVVVVVIVKGSNSAVKFKYLAISVVVVWIACVAVGVILVVPGVIELIPSNCSTKKIMKVGSQMWIFSTLYFLFFVIIPFTLATVMPVYALCYIRSNLVSENAASLKRMLKFAVFLLFGNVLCFFGQSITVAGFLISKDVHVDDWLLLALKGVYIGLLALSLIPTPILIFVYFKPVRVQMRKCVLRVCGKWCRRWLVISKQDPLTEMMLASPANDDL